MIFLQRLNTFGYLSHQTKTGKNFDSFYIVNVCFTVTKWQPIKKSQCFSNWWSYSRKLFFKTTGLIYRGVARNDPSSFNVRPFKNNVPIVIPYDYFFVSMIMECILLERPNQKLKLFVSFINVSNLYTINWSSVRSAAGITNISQQRAFIFH